MKLKFISMFFALFAFTLFSYADPKVDEILENSVKNAGGKAKYDDIKTIMFQADINITAQNVDIKQSFWMKKPDMMRILTDIPSMAMKIEAGTDGKTFWGTQPGSDKRSSLPDGALDQIKQQLAIMSSIIIPPMIDYKEKSKNYSYKGTETIDEKPCVVLVLTEEDSSKSEIYFDAISNLVYCTKQEIDAQGQKFIVVMKILEYQRVNGMTIPKRIEASQNGEVQQKITINEVKFNTEIADSDFLTN